MKSSKCLTNVNKDDVIIIIIIIIITIIMINNNMDRYVLYLKAYNSKLNTKQHNYEVITSIATHNNPN